MKKEQAALLILLGAVCHVIAQQQNSTQASAQFNAASASQTNTAASATIVAAKIHLGGPADPARSQRLQPVEGLDPQAWTTVAESRTSRGAFPTGETQHAGLCVIWWGSEPQHQ